MAYPFFQHPTYPGFLEQLRHNGVATGRITVGPHVLAVLSRGGTNKPRAMAIVLPPEDGARVALKTMRTVIHVLDLDPADYGLPLG